MEFKDLLEIAQFLNKNEDVAKINKLIEFEKNKNFYLTFWGHYSAGKSKLINRILDKNLLPVQVRETTSILTYIQYGEIEKCLFFYEDGIVKEYEISVLKNVFQNTNSFDDIDKIDHIEVYINNNLLEKGLVLVDTPGINTVIQKHQNLAIDAIEQSGRIIYVLGGSPNDADREFIKQITNCGVKIDFVRTKCDKFIEEEENISLSLEEEQKELVSFLQQKFEYIPVSNEENNKWAQNINNLRNLLLKISNDISKEINTSIEKKKKKIAEKYIKDLKEKEKYLNSILENNLENINLEIDKYNQEIEVFSNILNNLENKINKKTINIKKEIQREIDILITRRTEKFSKSLISIENNEEVKQIYLKHLLETIEKIQGIINLYLDETIKEESKELLSHLIDDEKLPSFTYSEVQQENKRTLEMYNCRLKEIKGKLKDILQQKEENRELLKKMEENFDEKSYDEAFSVIEDELSKIPSEVAFKISEDQEIQPSSFFKAIGTAADLALLLLPGEVIFAGVKTAANTTKIAQGIHKLGKVGETLKKAGTVIGKNAGMIDRVRDVAYTVNTVLGKRNYSTKAEKMIANKLVDQVAGKVEHTFNNYKESRRTGNALDALSIAYWTEKFGKNFDDAPKMEIDIEEQERRKEMRNKIALEQKKIIFEKMERKKELGFIKTKAEELRLLEDEQIQAQRKIEEEIKRQEIYIKKVAYENALNNYKEKYLYYYQERIVEIANEIFEKYFKTVKQNIMIHLTCQSKEVLSKLEIKRDQLSNLISLKNNEEIKKEIYKCKNLLEKVEKDI